MDMNKKNFPASATTAEYFKNSDTITKVFRGRRWSSFTQSAFKRVGKRFGKHFDKHLVKMPTRCARGHLTLILTLSLSALLLPGKAYAAPEKPVGLTGDINDTTVSLQWTANATADTNGYNVYRDNQYVATVFNNEYEGPVDANTLYSFNIVAFGGEPVEFSDFSDKLTLPEL